MDGGREKGMDGGRRVGGRKEMDGRRRVGGREEGREGKGKEDSYLTMDSSHTVIEAISRACGTIAGGHLTLYAAYVLFIPTHTHNTHQTHTHTVYTTNTDTQHTKASVIFSILTTINMLLYRAKNELSKCHNKRTRYNHHGNIIKAHRTITMATVQRLTGQHHGNSVMAHKTITMATV